MAEQHLDGSVVTLIPARQGAVALGVGPADNGKLHGVLTVDTATLGRFQIPLTATDMAMLATVSKTLLGMDPEQAKRLRDELGRANEGNNDE